jgi:hypothetical protein
MAGAVPFGHVQSDYYVNIVLKYDNLDVHYFSCASGHVCVLSSHHAPSGAFRPFLPLLSAALQVKANMVELAKSKYGHHLVLKLIKVAAKEDMPGE